MFGLFKKGKPSFLVVTLNARLQPLDRGELEDAVEAAMAKRGQTIRIVGGGTLMEANGEVVECDIEIEIDQISDDAIRLLTRTFEAILAPKGSRLSITNQNKVISFGRQEGLALYLNGTDLPNEVYRDCDSNHVYDECDRLLEGVGRVHSHWMGPTETVLYIYGSDFRVMHDRLRSFLDSYPLCRKCRVEKIA